MRSEEKSRSITGSHGIIQTRTWVKYQHILPERLTLLLLLYMHGLIQWLSQPSLLSQCCVLFSVTSIAFAGQLTWVLCKMVQKTKPKDQTYSGIYALINTILRVKSVGSGAEDAQTKKSNPNAQGLLCCDSQGRPVPPPGLHPTEHWYHREHIREINSSAFTAYDLNLQVTLFAGEHHTEGEEMDVQNGPR